MTATTTAQPRWGRSAYCGCRLCSAGCWPADGPGREGWYGSGGGACADVRWDQSAALHHSALAAARQAGDRLGEADAFRELGALQRETGSYPAAAATLARALALYRDVGDQPGQASALNELGFLRVLTGDYPAAAALSPAGTRTG